MAEKACNGIEMKTEIIVRIEFELSINCGGCSRCCTEKGSQNNYPEKQQSAILFHFLL